MTKPYNSNGLMAVIAPLAMLALVSCAEADPASNETAIEGPQDDQIGANDIEGADAEASAADEAVAPVAVDETTGSSAPGRPVRSPATQAPPPPAPDPAPTADPHAGHDMSNRPAEDMHDHD